MSEQTLQVASAAPAERPASQYRDESKSILLVMLELFFSRWMLICGIFLSTTFWSYLTLARAPDTYEAMAQVWIDRAQVQSIMTGVPLVRQQEEVGSDVDILRSIAVLDEVVRQLLMKAQASVTTDLPPQPLIFDTYQPGRPYNPLQLSDMPLTDPAALRKMLRNQLQINKFGESNVIEVALVSRNALFASETVNTLLDVYEKFNLKVTRSPGQSAFFRQEVDQLDQEINAYQAQLSAYMQQHGVADVDKERELVTLRRHAAQVQLDELQLDKAGLQTDLRAIDDPKTRLQASFLRNDLTIVKMRENVFLRQNQLAELRSHSTPDNPQVIAKQEELDELRRNLQREEELAIAQQRHLYQQVLDKEAEVLDKIRQLDVQLGGFPTMQAEIDRLQRDIQQRTLKRVELVEQMIRASTLESPDQSLNKVKILAYSQVPPFPRDARKGFKFLVAVVFSLIASFVVAIFIESLDHSIRRREEIEAQLSVPYLASLSTHYR
jgi:uncharacterized protein involved in exopolysaccharide biosynthesis